MRRVSVIIALVASLASACGGSSGAGLSVPNGDAGRGSQLISDYGCGACHTIPGVDGATGEVGPPLGGFARRLYVAGQLPNTPANLIRWIRTPQSVYPGNVMPDLGVSQNDARDIAAYLYQH